MPENWYLDLDSDGRVVREKLPLPIQMKAFGVGADGVEHEIGTYSSEPWSIDDPAFGSGMIRRSIQLVKEPIEPPFTIILRPDREAAKATFTLTSIYDGEVRIPVKKVLYSDQNYQSSYKTKKELLDAIERESP